jgi:hypothetical protein
MPGSRCAFAAAAPTKDAMTTVPSEINAAAAKSSPPEKVTPMMAQIPSDDFNSRILTGKSDKFAKIGSIQSPATPPPRLSLVQSFDGPRIDSAPAFRRLD